MEMIKNLFSSGPKVAIIIVLIAGLFVLIFLEDNKASRQVLSPETEISSQEKINIIKDEIKALELKIIQIKEKEGKK